MEAEKKTYYECPACGDDHESIKEVTDCCKEDLPKRVVYECGYCAEEFDTKKEANACCPEERE